VGFKIGIGGGIGPFRAGISTRGAGVGIGPFSAGVGRSRRRRRSSASASSPGTGAVVFVIVLIIAGWNALNGADDKAPDKAQSPVVSRYAVPVAPTPAPVVTPSAAYVSGTVTGFPEPAGDSYRADTFTVTVDDQDFSLAGVTNDGDVACGPTTAEQRDAKVRDLLRRTLPVGTAVSVLAVPGTDYAFVGTTEDPAASANAALVRSGWAEIGPDRPFGAELISAAVDGVTAAGKAGHQDAAGGWAVCARAQRAQEAAAAAAARKDARAAEKAERAARAAAARRAAKQAAKVRACIKTLDARMAPLLTNPDGVWTPEQWKQIRAGNHQTNVDLCRSAGDDIDLLYGPF
jgi:hypothetical protein